MNEFLKEFILFTHIQKEKFPNITDDNIIKDFLNNKKIVMINQDFKDDVFHCGYGGMTEMEALGALRYFEKKMFIAMIEQKPKEVNND